MDYKIEPNQSAFPSTMNTQTWGLTKREFLASIALAGLLSNPEFAGESFEALISSAIEATDLLIQQLERP